MDIAVVEVQITIPTKMQITWFELQFTFSTLISHLIVNNATIIFRKVPNETFNLNLKSRHMNIRIWKTKISIPKEAEVKIHRNRKW